MTEKSKLNPIFLVTLLVVGGMVVWGIINPESYGAATHAVLAWCFEYTTWWFLLGTNLFLLFPLYMAFSRYGKMKLGDPDEVPEYSTATWLAVLFGGGMGVGLVFYGVAAPILILAESPYGTPPGTTEAAIDGLYVAFYHWGFHPWACYTLIGLCLGYFQFRKKKPGLMSSLLLPILGPKGNYSIGGRIVDILSSFAIVAGISTSIGLTGMQINSGLSSVFGVPVNIGTQVMIIAVVGVIFTWSTVSGFQSGIKFMGNLNMWLTILLCSMIFILGPTMTIVEGFVTGVGAYFDRVIWSSFNVAPFGGEYRDWIGNWTVFYWAWWISWTPFVGAFVARISRGRSVREFVIGVYVVPTLGCWAWFAIFGTTALNMELTDIAEVAAATLSNIADGTFVMFENMPVGGIMSMILVALVATYLVTSANASTFAVAMFTSEGDVNPSKLHTATWGVLQTALGIILLATGGLASLQTASVASAAPFSFIMVLAAYCLIKTLRQDFPEGSVIK